MKKRTSESGMAMIFTMMAIIIIAGTLALAMNRTRSAKMDTDRAIDQMLLQEAAQAGIEIVTRDLWRQYIETSGNTTRNWASYRAYLNSTLGIPINEDLNDNGILDPGEDGNGNGYLNVPPGEYDPDGKEMLDEPRAFTHGDDNQVLATIESVKIKRFDGLEHSLITVTSTATLNGASKKAVQVLDIGAPTRNHAQFAIIANNISCTICHADILSLDLEYNNDPDMFGEFNRNKVASLLSLMVRKSGAESNLAGTLYTRGDVLDDSGKVYSNGGLASTSFKAYDLNDENGKIVQNGSGGMSQIPMALAGTTPEGDLEQFGSLYRNYPTDESQQTDGSVPNSFPAPYPDDDEDRYVDDDEFEMVKNTSNGRIQFEADGDDQGGAITAGVAFGVPRGGAYAGAALPTTSNDAMSSLKEDGAYDGNLILVGSEDDPINISGTVAVDGDLVLAGPIKGDGQLLVRGNTYVVGDVTYADGTKFGQAEDGTENAFALVSGGSILMGDYNSIRGVNHTGRNGEQFPNWSKYSIHTRKKNVSGTDTVSGSTQTLKYGYFDQFSVDPNAEINSGRPGTQFSFAMSELQLFNMMELNRAKADPTYTPRFYGLRESQPNNIWVFDTKKANNEEHSVKYNYKGVYTLAEYVTSFGLDPSILTRAAYHYLNPQGNWMSEDTLRQIWWDDEMTRPSSGRPFQFDGLLYSNNSIFSISRSGTRHNSNAKGQMILRGGVISSDLGIFVPEGLQLLYDPRVERFIELRDQSVVTYSRLAFYFED
ncbi:MAG: hypothetical protein GC168_05545 [Candidatus Hydrogenedens sp.]|nr:hypothetical protein [Candidatus Hydrogenedens sp.]